LNGEEAGMSEQEWLECTDPQLMLASLEGKSSNRKLRFFACACCRRIWDMIVEADCQRAIEISEQYADSKATEQEAHDAMVAAACCTLENEQIDGFVGYLDDQAMTAVLNALGLNAKPRYAAEMAATVRFQKKEQETGAQTHLLRDIFGNPFRPVELNPRWLTPDVTGVAQAIYEERAFDRMPILGDALMDAGCIACPL